MDVYSSALAFVICFQWCVPPYCVITALDLALLPITGLHDLVVLLTDDHEGPSFEDRVRARRDAEIERENARR